uniref:DUF4126 domain-containing protein n=2 Tax=Strongyloides papillosus TaxID=174720 RepID=A0A0N5C244_STREA
MQCYPKQGHYDPLNQCQQYCETPFASAGNLMENVIVFILGIIFKLFLGVLEEYCPRIFRRLTRRPQEPAAAPEPPTPSTSTPPPDATSAAADAPALSQESDPVAAASSAPAPIEQV